MTEKTKLFIEQNIQLIEQCEFKRLYAMYIPDTGELTETLLAADLDPLQHMDYIPQSYLENTQIKSFSVPNNIVEIRNNAFHWCAELTKVELPENIFLIGDEAFCESGLTHINLPESLNYILESAFAETELKHVQIPNNIRILHKYCFEECLNLESVILGSSVEKIREGVFGNCSQLHSITLNEGLKFIENFAFKGCESLTEIKIPESVIKIGPEAFYGCTPKIICKPRSAAYDYALDHDFDFELY